MEKLSRETADLAVSSHPITILQFGSGNFLRAFADWMIQKLNDSGQSRHAVAIVYPTDRPDRHDPLQAQDGLYHVVLEGVKNAEPIRTIDRVDVVERIIDPYRDWDAYQQVALSPDLQIIVSNTTEAGICWQEGVALEANPPRSFPAQVARLLHDRFLIFDGALEAGLAIVPCELIENNGQRLCELVLRHAEEAGYGSEFAGWVVHANHFYDTLVDRIVAGYPTDNAQQIHQEIGFTDGALVKGEFFSLWAIGGDDYLASVLPLDTLDLGVCFLPREEIARFRDKKVRILNGAHTAIAQIGLQLGADTVGEGFRNPLMRAYVDALVDEEVLPTINEDDGNLSQFAETILERFDNPYLHHALNAIALNSVSKWKTRNLPVLRDRWNAGLPAPRTAFVLAALLTLYSGKSSAADFTPRDDQGVVDFIQSSFDRENLHGWSQGIIERFNLGEGLTEAGQGRLIEVTADSVRMILTDGMAKALRFSEA